LLNITPAAPLVCTGMTIWVMTTRDRVGVSSNESAALTADTRP